MSKCRHTADWSDMCTGYGRLYIGVTRTLGVVWVCRRFDYSHFCRRFGVGVLTCRRFEHRPSVLYCVTVLIHSNSLQTLFVIGLFANVSKTS